MVFHRVHPQFHAQFAIPPWQSQRSHVLHFWAKTRREEGEKEKEEGGRGKDGERGENYTLLEVTFHTFGKNLGGSCEVRSKLGALGAFGGKRVDMWV